MPASRTRLLALALLTALLLLATACGSDGDEAEASRAEANAAETRLAETLNGSVEVPVDPKRVFAIDEYAGAIMLSMGFEPIGALTPYAARVPATILDDAGVETIEAVFGEWNYELVAERDPDLIVLIDPQDPTVFESLSAIAPTVVLPFVAPWRDGLDAVSEATGDADRIERIEAAMEARIEELAATTGERAVLSVLGSGPTFGTFSLGHDTPTSGIIDEAGYGRPVAQDAPATMGAIIPLSPETLGEHDGDVVVALGGDDRFYSIAELTGFPTYAGLPAVADGRSVEALGEIWVNSDPFSMFWVIEDLAAIAAGGSPATFDDLDDRWAAYLQLGDE
ncbi:MAG: ABC transporter substrate-binding protein [Actinomycetota bacterium]